MIKKENKKMLNQHKVKGHTQKLCAEREGLGTRLHLCFFLICIVLFSVVLDITI